VTPIKLRVLEAAVELLGTEGLRALTHARVDAQAGIPHGSTSNYFRTRAQLLMGVNDWIGEHDLASTGDVATVPQTAADLVEGLAVGIEMLTGPHRVVTAARLTLFMEANHNPAIRASVAQTRTVMERSMMAVMARLGATDPYSAALALMACCEGIILHRIARHDSSDPRPLLRVVASAALVGD
jgi:DNA-binding transcriptional regulator YbjK